MSECNDSVGAGIRVSFLAHSFPRYPGGGPRVFYEHANRLSRRGYDVTVVHSMLHRTGRRELLADVLRDRARDIRAGLLRRRIRWMEVDARVRLTFVDRFDENTVLPTADIRIGTYWATTRYLGSLLGRDAATMQLIQAYETWAAPAELVDATWRLPIHTAVVSAQLRRRGLELGVPSGRLHVVPNGIDHDVFRLTTPVVQRPLVVAFLAHESAVKGMAEAVEVSERVRVARPDVRFVAFGAHARPAMLPAFISYLRRPVGRDLAGRVYNACAVFLCASHSEGFGFPSLESMACGAALVSTRNGGVDDFAVDGESALLADVGDIDGLAARVLDLLGDGARRGRLAEAGMQSAQRFSWDASSAAFEDVVRATLRDAHPR